tara:strand:- start:1265 stop:2392 length:1128 start_codon:yes stop_codon:yes gene_type:complete
MAVYKLFPTADATIYSGYPTMNTGLDEILDASSNYKVTQLQVEGNYPQASRFLIKFDQSEIQNIFSSLIEVKSWQANLRCFVANVTGINNTTTLNINALAEDWAMGTGKFLDSPENSTGASWIFKSYSGSNAWTTSGYVAGTTGSYNLTLNPNSAGGGVWYTGSQASQSFTYYSDLDIDTNITSIVTRWSSSAFSNYGVIVRQSSSQEFISNILQQNVIRYFSRDTHTIYPPCLELKWDDSAYSTGSLPAITSTPTTVAVDNNLGVFYSGSVNTFRVNARPTNPPKIWQTASLFTINYALPQTTYYAIKDLDTDEFVVDFDSNYTKVSCDSTSNYFTLYMNGLEPERYYKILIRSTIGATTTVFDNNYIFKVVNG